VSVVDDVVARLTVALPADAAAVVVVADAADRAIADRLGGQRSVIDARAVRDGTWPAPGAPAILLASVLAAPDHEQVLAAARAAECPQLVALVRNAGHADRRLAALELQPADDDRTALALATARDRLEAGGFVVDVIERVRRAPSRSLDWLGGEAALDVGRLVARDPDSTVDWFVLRATASDAGAQLAALRERAGQLERERAADEARAREVAEAAMSGPLQAERTRARTLQRQLEVSRQELAFAQQSEVRAHQEAEVQAATLRAELEGVRAALREQADRAERAEAALAALEQTRALRAAQTVWRMKARVLRP
jgi:hypothetical protein